MRDSAKTGKDIQVMKCSTAVEAANEFMIEYADVMQQLASCEKETGMEEVRPPEQVVHLLAMPGMDETYPLSPAAE